ncbi:MAG: hypothetical protein JO165_07655 [Candidatus Eremiobacteraeota bacterium]|nr:hypothetical protein [Candidatus Eremiobacteraeota bacterium]
MRAKPVIFFTLIALFIIGSAPATTISIDDSEARAALAILHKLQQHGIPTQDDWARLFATRGYERLEQREAQFKVPFTESQFKAFLTSPSTVAQTDSFEKTIDAWTSASLSEMESRARAYLPADSTLRATVYPLIKQRKNSFVYQLDTDPAIMLYVDAAVSQAQFTNTVSHELLHVGDAENCPPPDVRTNENSLSPRQEAMLEWLSAFGEGWAVLAAAPGPNVHPHVADSAADRAVWDTAISHFDGDFQTLQSFFAQISDGTLQGDAISRKGMVYFGDVQGPWYTVGYRMDVTIERELGRPILINALCDKRVYLQTYNRAAQKVNAREPAALPLWPVRLTDFLTAEKHDTQQPSRPDRSESTHSSSRS